MSNTIVIWNVDTPSQSEVDEIELKVIAMSNEGKTDDIPEISFDDVGRRIVHRTWTTRDDAVEWIDFVERFNPHSATIEE
jgi:hypothetical protein